MKYDDIDLLWTEAIKQILSEGDDLESRNGGSKEILGFSATLKDARKSLLYNSTRNMSPIYAAGELMWYLAGSDDGDHIMAYAPSYANYLDDGKAFGAYGHRWLFFNQLETLHRTLEEKPESRQAVLSMWQGRDLGIGDRGTKKDLPCTLSLQFLVRDGALHQIATMRSNDAWMGMPYDIWCFTTLQILLAESLGLEVGSYTHNVGSLHLYDKHLKKARTVEDECGTFTPFIGAKRLYFIEAKEDYTCQENALREERDSFVDGIEVDYPIIRSHWDFIFILCQSNFVRFETAPQLSDELNQRIKYWSEKNVKRHKAERSN